MARPFFGLSIPTLLEYRQAAQEQLLKGTSVTSFGNESGNTSVQLIAHARARIDEINRELYALGYADADPEITDPRHFAQVSFN